MTGLAGLRVMVLGGTGFVGRQICEDLAEADTDVLAVARTRPEEPFAHRFQALDLATAPDGELDALLSEERPNAIVNATGSIWGLLAEEMEAGCAVPSRRLMDALERIAWRRRLVHLGSVLEYGPIPKGGRTDPRLPARPDTAYGKAKLTATREVLAAAQAERIDAVVLRIANVVGPGTPAISLLGRVTAQLAGAQDDEAVVEMTALRAHRDYVDVRDASAAVIAALSAPVTGQVIDIGRGEALPVRELVRLLIEASGVSARLVVVAPDPATERAGEDWIRVDPAPARELLGWRPRHDLRDSLSTLWRTYRAAPIS